MGRHCNTRRLIPALVAALLVAAGCTATQSSGGGEPPATARQGSGGINRAEHLAKPYLVLVSIDGFRPDYLDRFELPNLRRAMRRGARARGMLPVFPTITFPNHYSLVTGIHPGGHGIVENGFWDPARGARYSFRDQAAVADSSWYGGEPIWVTAERQGMVAACFFWPGSEAPIKGLRATFWNTYNGGVPNATRVKTVIEWLKLPDRQRPHVITLYFSDVDSASHNNPLDSDAVHNAARAVDSAVGALVDGIDALPLRDRTFVLLTSDHGMAETASDRVVLLRSLIDTTGIRAGFHGPVTSLHVEGGDAAAIRVRDALNGRVKSGRAYLRRDLPERFHARDNPRFGDVVVVMDEGWFLATSVLTRALVQSRWGEHGWDNALPSMQALFLISGPDIRGGTVIPQVANVDVYPLLTELLGLEAAEGIDGRAGLIRGLLRDAAPE